MRFEWDPRKAGANFRKYGIPFREAATVVGDPLAWTFTDPDHSRSEERLITIGSLQLGNKVVITHTHRGDVGRIISAHRATSRERPFSEEEK